MNRQNINDTNQPFDFPEKMKSKINAVLIALQFIVCCFSANGQPADVGDTSIVNTLNATGIAYQKSNPDSALIFHIQAKKLSEKIGESILIGESIKNIGFDYFLVSNYMKALDCYEQVIKLSDQQINNGRNKKSVLRAKKLKGAILGNIGIVFGSQNDFSKALEYFYKSIEVFEDLGDEKVMVRTYNNIGFIYKNLGEYDKSLESFKKALTLAQKLNFKDAIDNIYSGFAEVYSLKNDNVNALEYYQKAVKISEETGDNYSIIISLLGIGRSFAVKGEYEKTLPYYLKAFELAKEIGDIDKEIDAVRDISIFYTEEIKNYSSAKEYLKKWSLLLKELNDPNEYRLYYEALSRFYEKTNKPDLALINFKKYTQLKDSLFGRENISRSLQQEFKISYEKRFAADSVIAEEEKKSANIRLELSETRVQQANTQKLLLYSGLVIVLLFTLFIFNRFKVTQRQKLLIEFKEQETQKQKYVIEEKQKEILDSINYAKRIQHSLLAPDQLLKDNLMEHFVYFNPKDIVSGDFYWATKKNNKFYIAVCDSTGHGVPGAFMSLLNIGFLAEAINEKEIEKPNEVFDFVRDRLTNTVSKEGQKDGFDGVLMCFDQKNKNVTYAAANNRPVLVQDGQLTELPGDRMPVGVGEKKDQFSLYSIQMNSESRLYLYTDGFPDQFGGPKGKKLKSRQLNDIILVKSNKPFDKQKNDLEHTFRSWRGNLEQVDDICLIGLRI
ncbi:MAG: tetratricopeptide repeat protein [Bacteroidota bacterium]